MGPRGGLNALAKKKSYPPPPLESNSIPFICTFRTLVTVLTELYCTTIQLMEIVLFKENHKQTQL
jgi:hypothetical protein